MSAPRSDNLQDIENSDWGEPSAATSVERTVRELRRVPIGELTADQMALLVRQGVGLPTLVPLALDSLENEIAPAAEMYPGELLLSLISANHWHDIPQFRRRLVTLIENAKAAAQEHPQSTIHENNLKKMRAWVAAADSRTDRQKRDEAKQFRDWWLKLGGDDVFAPTK